MAVAAPRSAAPSAPKSPSSVFAEIGEQDIAGFVAGVEDAQGDAVSVMERVAQATVDAWDSTIEAADGIGVGLESRLLIQRELDTGRLVLPFGMTGPLLVCHRLLFLKSKARVPKIKALREWLAAELAASVM